jgi:hypothetical protein
MKKITLLLTFIAVSLSAVSQNDTTIINKSNFDWGITLFGGTPNSANITRRYENLGKLVKSNRNLSKNKIGSQFSEVIPLGFGLRIKRLKISTEITLPTFVREGEVSTISGNIVLGYDVLNSRNYRIYPYFGFGKSQNTFTPIVNNQKTVDFKDLSDPNFGVAFPNLYNSTSSFDFGIEFSHREKKSRSFGWYSRIGYRLAQNATPWKSRQLIITNSPIDKVNQLYFTYGVVYSVNRKKQES